MTSADGGERELILRVATRLFAALGYDATSTSQIAEAAGVGVATLNDRVGSKRELYLTVMEQAYLAELNGLEASISEISVMLSEKPVAAVHRLLEDYIDFCAQNPEITALWMHRWLSDASDVTELERQYVQPVVQRTADVLGPIVPGSADLLFVIWAVTWATHSFSSGGILDREGNRVGPEDPETLARFRAHMHKMVHYTLDLPGSPP